MGDFWADRMWIFISLLLVALCVQAQDDYQFQCETTCALEGSEGTSSSNSKKKTLSLDFGFDCATTCQLVATFSGGTSYLEVDGTTGASEVDATEAAFMELSSLASPQTPTTVVGAEPATPQAKKESCYRLCLNPKTNLECNRAAQHVVLLQTGEMSQEELMASLEPHLQTQAGNGGDCLATCVRVCTDRIPAPQ